MKVLAILRKKHNDKTGKSEWALVSRKSGRVLRWFGAQHPSEERVAEEERRIQYFKHHGSYQAIARVLAAAEFTPPTRAEIVQVLRKHPLIRLKEKVKRAFLIGSFAAGKQNDESDVDILLEVEPHPDQTAAQLADQYRRPLQQYFVTHDIRGKDDSVHPQWAGRRVDLYFTYDADKEDDRPKKELA